MQTFQINGEGLKQRNKQNPQTAATTKWRDTKPQYLRIWAFLLKKRGREYM